jgi:excisionase family DNA binding protein
VSEHESDCQIDALRVRVAELEGCVDNLKKLIGELKGHTCESSDDLQCYSPPEAAKVMRCYSDDKVRRLCESGAFPGAIRSGAGKHWRIPRADVKAFLERSRPTVRRRA